MKPFATLGLIAALCLTQTGCGSDPEPDTQALIADCNAFADAVAKKEPDARLQELADKIKADKARQRGLKATESKMKEVMDKYGNDLQIAGARLVTAVTMAKRQGSKVDLDPGEIFTLNRAAAP